MKTGTIWCQQTYTRNAKRGSLRWREMIPDEIPDLEEEMEEH